MDWLRKKLYPSHFVHPDLGYIINGLGVLPIKHMDIIMFNQLLDVYWIFIWLVYISQWLKIDLFSLRFDNLPQRVESLYTNISLAYTKQEIRKIIRTEIMTRDVSWNKDEWVVIINNKYNNLYFKSTRYKTRNISAEALFFDQIHIQFSKVS